MSKARYIYRRVNIQEVTIMESTNNIIEVSYRFEGNSNYEHDYSETLEGIREMFDSFIELEQKISDITITVKANNLDELSTLLW